MTNNRIKIPNMKADAHKANALLNQLLDLLCNLPESSQTKAKIIRQVSSIANNVANELEQNKI